MAAGVLPIATFTANASAKASAEANKKAAHSSAAKSRQTYLITGDIITVTTTPGGPPVVGIEPPTSKGPGGQSTTYMRGGDEYVVPASARASVAAGVLDESLFDVTQLAKSPGPLKVSVTFRQGVKATPIPGVSKDGTVTLASARKFGTELAKPHSTALAGVAHISVAGAVTPARVSPKYEMETLTIQVTDPTGVPQPGSESDGIQLWNVDDLNRYNQFTWVSAQGGATKISVPKGNYAALGSFTNVTQDQKVYTFYTMAPQFAVNGDTTLNVDANSANQQVQVNTPTASVRRGGTLIIDRGDAVGGHDQLTAQDAINGDAYTFIQPTTTAPTIGSLHLQLEWRAIPPGIPTGNFTYPYTYDVFETSDGTLPASETYNVASSELTTVKDMYGKGPTGTDSTGTPNVGGEGWVAIAPWNADKPVNQEYYAFTTGASRTDYITPRPNLYLSHRVMANFNSTPADWFYSGFHLYQAGQTINATWLTEPTTPRLFEGHDGLTFTDCPACQVGSTVGLHIYPFGDSDPDHYGLNDTYHAYVGSYQVYADNTQLASQTNVPLVDTSVTLPSGTKSLRVVYDSGRDTTLYRLSTQVHTEWTAVENGVGLGAPSDWYCPGGATSCQTVPLLNPYLSLPVNASGQISSGTANGSLTVHNIGGVPYSIGSVTAQVSFDGGTTWQPVTVSGSGAYQLSFTVPSASATNGYGWVQLTATDSAGDKVTQTVQNAFAIAP